MPQNGIPLKGDEIRRRRERLALSQEQLAAKADIHPDTLGSVESNPQHRAGFKTIRALARVFGCEPADLYREPEEVAS
jgi:DNA-binding XRE family transcriptional regulator